MTARWQKGQSGNPNGKGKRPTMWRDAILAAVREAENDRDIRRALRKLALSLIRQAKAGDVTALKEIGQRLDGNPESSLTIEHSGDITHHAEPVSDTLEWLKQAQGEPEIIEAPKSLPN